MWGWTDGGLSMVQYSRPSTVDHAITLLADAGGAGRVLVGGTDLLVHVRRQPLEPLVLVDLKTASDLPAAIEVSDHSVTFGPTATMGQIAANPTVQQWFPSLVLASQVVGSVAIRNRATIIGNICNSSPACDTAPALLTFDATVTIRSLNGERTVPLQDFFTGPGQNVCEHNELVVGLELSKPPAGHTSGFQRLTRRRGVDLATVSVAAAVSAEGEITLGLGAVAPTPLLTATSGPVDTTDAAAVRSAVTQLVEVASPISDVRATKEYRQAMSIVLAERAVKSATSEGAS